VACNHWNRHRLVDCLFDRLVPRPMSVLWNVVLLFLPLVLRLLYS